ncbi:hypothetical protein [Sulfitobacter sp. S190]|uniref:hypothetical protein n=1 Tax=Sulfitobacter sp. S190 TaxID=2867022 RepID=UPI0021A6F1CF|nr:hypothetical protein [Sulfitobacter sp. S190]UWR24427.1 hypothetical protein K3756_18370 [Sulfitobacter sp. S190]
MARLSADDIARIADRVSQVMQLDRTRHHVSSAPDLAAQVNIPGYLARIFEQAGSVSGAISNEALYDLVNKRIARLEASLYLARVELENRSAHEPSEIYADPMMVSAYAERVSHVTSLPRSYSFEPSVLAHGWYPVESVGEHYHRWMRPMDESALACLPHLGQIDQVIEIEGRVLHADQLENLSIKFGDIAATITQKDEMPEQFVATLALSAQDVAHSNYVAIAFDMTDFRQPNEADKRLLGINLRRFTCRPEAQAE